jgi:hypothetical protein
MQMNTTTTKIAGEAMTDERLKPGHCHKCGLPLSDNPHPEAGKPPHYLQVGCPKGCIPCLTLSRHQWAGRAMRAENQVKDLLASKPAENSDELKVCLGCNSNWPLHDLDCHVAVEALSAPTAPAQSCGDAEQADARVDADERSSFEAAWRQEYPLHSATTFKRSGFNPDVYATTRVQDGWLMWQARAKTGHKNATPRQDATEQADEAELTEEMIDAARPLFLAMECGAKSIESIRDYFVNSGSTIVGALPEWFRTGTGHLTKAGKAIIAWHAMEAARKDNK